MVKLKGFQKLTSTDQALQTWLASWQTRKPILASEPLADALGRVLGEDIVAKDNLPRFNKSAVDGFALKSADTTSASQFKPMTFQLVQNQQVVNKQAKQVWTGNPIPEGADSVVMLENTNKQENELDVWSQLAPGDNISMKGEDVKKGTVVAKAGTRLNPYHIGLLAALGYSQLKVVKKPKIAIIVTGNELTDVGEPLTGNLIYDSNKIMISTICKELGAETPDLELAKDNLDEISSKIWKALETADAVITTGGTSVGGLDLVPDSVNKLGKPGVLVHGMALRPAMPTAVAVLEGKPVLILSGNPVASVIGFEVFGRPMISRLLGMNKTEPRPMLKATLTRKVSGALGRKTYVRVRVSVKNGEFYAEPVSAKGSGSISTMTQSNGFVIIPENREGLSENEIVMVHIFGSLEVED